MPLQLPCSAELVEFDARDGTGKLRTQSGELIKCGATSFAMRRSNYRWRPKIGEKYRVVEAQELPRLGLRATTILTLDDPGTPPETAPRRPMPTDDFNDAIEWLRASGERVSIAPRGANVDEIATLESQLGRKLPGSYVEFLREHHWLKSRRLTTFAVADGAEVPAMAERTRAVRQYIDKTLADPTWAGHVAHEHGSPIASSLALVQGADHLPLGDGLFLDEGGSFRWAALKEFQFVASVVVRISSFEAWLLRTLAERYDESLYHDD